MLNTRFSHKATKSQRSIWFFLVFLVSWCEISGKPVFKMFLPLVNYATVSEKLHIGYHWDRQSENDVLRLGGGSILLLAGLFRPRVHDRFPASEI